MKYLSAVLLLSAAAVMAPQLAQAQPRGPGPQASGVVRCESDNGRRRECRIPGGASGRVEVTRQLSNSACIQGRTWGVRGNRVWVDRGCRAEFASYPGRRR